MGNRPLPKCDESRQRETCDGGNDRKFARIAACRSRVRDECRVLAVHTLGMAVSVVLPTLARRIALVGRRATWRTVWMTVLDAAGRGLRRVRECGSPGPSHADRSQGSPNQNLLDHVDSAFTVFDLPLSVTNTAFRALGGHTWQGLTRPNGVMASRHPVAGRFLSAMRPAR